MNNETLKIDLCVRAAYGVFAYENESEDSGYFILDIPTLASAIEQETEDRGYDYEVVFKPILFNSLTEPVTINGETFVPLRKMFDLIPLRNYSSFNMESAFISFQVDDKWNHCMLAKNIDASTDYETELCFSFDSDTKSFYLMVNDEVEFVSNQMNLFDFMNKNHINYRLSEDQFIPATNEYA